MKMISCKDVGVKCDFTAKAETEAELMKTLAKHAKEKHGMKEIPADIQKKVKQNMKTL